MTSKRGRLLNRFVILSAVFFLLLSVLMLGFGKFIYKKVIDNIFALPAHDFAEVNTLIIGDSHSMCSFNPQLIDKSINIALFFCCYHRLIIDR